MASQDHISTSPFRHSDNSLPPSYSQPRPSQSPSPQPSHPSTFDPRTTTTPETELFLPPKPKSSKKPIYNPPPGPRDLQAADISAPAYSEYYAPPPSTAYYPPVASQDVYDPQTGRMHNPYLTSGARSNPYMAPYREQRSWVWEYGSPCDCCSEEGWSPRLCGFRTRNMPPSQIACLLIPTLVVFVGGIVLAVVLANARANAAN